jgi:hypothetical protein
MHGAITLNIAPLLSRIDGSVRGNPTHLPGTTRIKVVLATQSNLTGGNRDIPANPQTTPPVMFTPIA